MKPNDLHNTIMGQIDNTRPAHLIPGLDVLAKVVDDVTVGILVVPTEVEAIIAYDEGPDLYNVTIKKGVNTQSRSRRATHEFEGVFCDQLGSIVFGEDAKPFTLPMAQLITWDEDGNPIVENLG